MSVLYGTILSDHIPVMVEIDLQLAPDIEHGTFNDVRWLILRPVAAFSSKPYEEFTSL